MGKNFLIVLLLLSYVHYAASFSLHNLQRSMRCMASSEFESGIPDLDKGTGNEKSIESTSQVPVTTQRKLSQQASSVFRSLGIIALSATSSRYVSAAEGSWSWSGTMPQITNKVYLDIKIANYTEESIGKNRGATGSGRIVFGLYGKDAPESVANFLKVIQSDGQELPSFYNTQFSKVSPEGALEVEKISGLRTIQLAGQEQYEYGGNLMPYKPILETNNFKHDRAGLLTRVSLSWG